MIGVKVPQDIASRAEQVMGVVDWSKLRDDSVFEQARSMMNELAKALGLPVFSTVEDAMSGVARPTADEMRAEVQRAVASQIEELIRRNILQVAAPAALQQVRDESGRSSLSCAGGVQEVVGGGGSHTRGVGGSTVGQAAQVQNEVNERVR